MTIAEVTAELRKQNKPYIGVMPQATFAFTLGRIEQGITKMKTIRAFFEAFHYEGDFNEWQKIDVPVVEKQLISIKRVSIYARHAAAL